MKTILNRNIRREFKFSFARFASIAVLLGLGVFVLVGLKVTGPDMRATGNTYYTEHHMADAVIKSDVAISKSDQTYMRNLPHIKKIEFSTYKDAVIKGSTSSIRVSEKTSTLSTSKISSGRLPTRSNEIALSSAEKGKYHLGQTITLVNNKGKTNVSGLKHTRYKVVGFVTSSDYLMKQNLGTTNAGTGQLTTFGVVTKAAFTSSRPTMAYVSYNNVHGAAYSNRYESQVAKNVNQVTHRLTKRADHRQTQLTTAASDKLNAAQKRLTAKQNTLTATKAKLSAAIKQDPQAASQYKTQEAVLAKQQAKLTAAQKLLTAQRQSLKKTSQLTYEIQSRNDYNSGYNQYGEDAKRIDVLANTFPIIFFAVAIMVTLITMTRMAEEKRQELGVLGALGYTKHDAMKVFIIYGVLAGLLGSAVGAWFGTSFLPRKIFAAYAANFTMPSFQTPPSLLWISVAVIISLLCATLPAIIVAAKQLREVPAVLMAPKPPKSGSKVLLERIPGLWQHLSFNHKVTIRNLFRYKSRMLMTILGVLGCTALLITGFGIRDSLNGIVKTQYSDIIHYDVIGVFNPNATSASRKAYEKKVDDLKGVKNNTKVYYESVTAKPTDEVTNQSVSLIVPKSTKAFKKDVTLRNPTTKKHLHLTNNGAIITKKLATITNVKKGDYLTIKQSDGDKYRVKVSGITEMYAGHDVYMNSTYYHKVFSKNVTYNANMLRLSNRSNKSINRVSRTLNKQSAALTAVQSNDAKTTINNILSGLNHLVLIIIIVASVLAFVVLFTLTNINVSERMRELSTIKVLGFYPMEVVMYVYRETFILTVAGILLGFIGGDYLHYYIMQTLPPETAMADMTLFWTNFTVSGLMTLGFSVVVMGLMAYKINRVDMLEALK